MLVACCERVLETSCFLEGNQSWNKLYTPFYNLQCLPPICSVYIYLYRRHHFCGELNEQLFVDNAIFLKQLCYCLQPTENSQACGVLLRMVFSSSLLLRSTLIFQLLNTHTIVAFDGILHVLHYLLHKESSASVSEDLHFNFITK